MRKTLAVVTILGALTESPWASGETLKADQIKTLREQIGLNKDHQRASQLAPEQQNDRQDLIDAEVTASFKKRIQMHPSDAAAIPPECDQWLLLYKETGGEMARAGIKATCP